MRYDGRMAFRHDRGSVGGRVAQCGVVCSALSLLICDYSKTCTYVHVMTVMYDEKYFLFETDSLKTKQNKKKTSSSPYTMYGKMKNRKMYEGDIMKRGVRQE